MLRFKFGAWAVVLMLAALSFGACSDEDDDPAFNPPSNITEALKQLYPAAQNIEWEMKDVYYWPIAGWPMTNWKSGLTGMRIG